MKEVPDNVPKALSPDAFRTQYEATAGKLNALPTFSISIPFEVKPVDRDVYPTPPEQAVEFALDVIVPNALERHFTDDSNPITAEVSIAPTFYGAGDYTLHVKAQKGPHEFRADYFNPVMRAVQDITYLLELYGLFHRGTFGLNGRDLVEIITIPRGYDESPIDYGRELLK